MMRTWIAMLLLSSLIAAPCATAGRPDPLPQGMGKYLVVLWESGTPVPGGKTKDGKEPDFAKLGGRLLYEKDNRRVIFLPLSAAKELRKHESVVYLQRLWTKGESLKGWNESYPNDDRFRVQTEGILTWGPKDYAYDGSGNITAAGGDHYTYDTAGRLIEAQVSGKTERYKYDSFGNLLEKGVVGGTADVIAVDSGTNRIEGAGYDVAGNVLTRGGRWEYEWDSAGMLWRIQKSTGSRRILYDASDERIGTIIDSVLSRWQIRDVDGQIIREYKGDRSGDNLYWFWEQDHVRAGGQLVAGETPEWTWGEGSPYTYGGERHYHLDHLGSVRLVTNDAGNSLSEHDYYPFGLAKTLTYQEQINLGDPHIDGMRFAGHWRDFLGLLNVENTEYLDYMHARYYDPKQGRFLSVDPVLQLKRTMSKPQLWNRYAYALNNPLVYTDPTGETVYVVTYTVGNASGDDEFRRAAETRAELIKGMKSFDSNRDTVLLSGVRDKADFAKTLATAKSLGSKYGKVGELSMFSHAGPVDGPTFHYQVAPLEQFSKGDLAKMDVNWEWWGNAKFFGCNTAVAFTQRFANAQGVTAYGYGSFAGFSGSSVGWTPALPGGPLYMIQTNSNYTTGGFRGAMRRYLGIDTSATPLQPADPQEP